MYTFVFVWFSCVFLNVFFYVKVFAFHGAKNGLNILSINSLSQNISFLYVLLLLSLLYFISFFSFSLSISVSCKKFMISAFFPLFFSHSHTVRKKSASLQSREFRFVCVCMCIMEWVCGYGERKKNNERDLFCLTCSFFLYFFCWDVLLCFTLLSNKSHSFSWTWHLELYFFIFNYFYHLLPIDSWLLILSKCVCVCVSVFFCAFFFSRSGN